MTAEQIYSQMLATFSEATGQPMDDGCDLAVRLYAAAAQMETLYQYADWSRKQAFPQTAGGQYLDYHAQMRDLTRRSASRAKGTVRIFLSDQQPDTLRFAAGTVLIAANDAEFTLDEDIEIPVGVRQYYANVTAVEAGRTGNLPANMLLSFLSGSIWVQKVMAVEAFAGGADTETDEDLRARILESFRPGGNGVNAAYYKALALTVDGIVACSVIPAARGPLTVDVVPANQDGMPTSAQLSQITILLAPRRELGIDISVHAPESKPIDLQIALRCAEGVGFEEAEAAAKAVISDYFTGRVLGIPVYPSALSHLVFSTGLVKDCAVTMQGGGERITEQQLPVLGSLVITEAI